MASLARSRLEALREALVAVDPYPWSAVVAWRARALPLFRESFPKHVADFESVTEAPRWLVLPRFSSRGNQWTGEGHRDNLADAAARENEANRRYAAEGRDKIVAWLDGLLEHLAAAPNVAKERKAPGKSVFLVHGHDEAAKQTVARFLERLHLAVIILHEQASRGQTVIEKFENHADVGFAVVLLTGDDLGKARSSSGEALLRARQNVVLELGYFLGVLGRDRVCALREDDVEVPSDLAGVLYVPFDKAGAWKLRIAAEIKAAGIEIDMNRAIA